MTDPTEDLESLLHCIRQHTIVPFANSPPTEDKCLYCRSFSEIGVSVLYFAYDDVKPQQWNLSVCLRHEKDITLAKIAADRQPNHDTIKAAR